jgi:hypothetical protein
VRNKFHQTVNKLINDNALEMYHSESLLYQHIYPYLKLTLPIEGVGELMFSRDVTHYIDEHHMTIFEDLEQQGEHSAFHYTAKLHSSDKFYVYRLRVFFNDKDQPIGVSWYRKALGESDDLYLQVELTAREIKLTMDFAAEQIKPLVYLIHDQQTTQVNNAKESYEALYRAYEQLIDAQVEGVPFAIGQALTYLADMKKCLHLQEELGIRSSRSKLAYITRLEALTHITHQPVTEKEAIEIPSSSIVELNLDESLAINPSQAIKVLNVSKPRIQTTELEKTFSDISLKHAAIPDTFKTIPTTTKKVLNEAYLIFIEGLQNDYRECCQQYLLTMESHSSVSELKHFKKLNLTMDLIAKEQERIEAKYVQTLLLFGDQTTDIMGRLRACQSAIESLMMNSIKLVIRNNKSNFLQLILDYKKFTTVELVDIMKVILATDSATECLSDVLKRYRIHSFLLQKDSTNVLLATYLFRLPMAHSMRLACVYDIPALSSSTFYQKLHVELKKSKDAALYDATTIARDIENVRMAESLYASSSEQKHQIRQNIEWIRQLPVSIQAALGRMSFEPGSSCEKKVTLIYQISREINTTIALLSVSNPAFVSRLKQESNSQMRQFKTAMCENEANFVEYLSAIDATRLEQDLDEMIEYYHLLNNYLRYCLPTSMDVLSEAARTELREHYFSELKRFGMKKNPYEALQGALSAMADGMRALGSLLEAHVRQLQYIQDHPNDVTSADIGALVSGFEAISSFAEAAQPLLDARETNPSIMRLK